MIDTLIAALFWISATLFGIILIMVVAMAWFQHKTLSDEMEKDGE